VLFDFFVDNFKGKNENETGKNKNLCGPSIKKTDTALSSVLPIAEDSQQRPSREETDNKHNHFYFLLFFDG
jgi:hypothetical protein